MASLLTEDEFIKSYDALADALFRHCYFRVYSRERAQELMQDTFLKAWQYNVQGKEIRSLKAFLYKIANNLVIDHSRKKKEVFLEDMKSSGNDPFGADQQSEHWEPSVDEREMVQNRIDGSFAMEALQQLEDDYRDVIVMRYVDGLSPHEIADAIGQSPNVVSVRLHRAIEKLRVVMTIKPKI